MKSKFKMAAFVAAISCAIPVLGQVGSPHQSSNAVFCDDGSFATRGMFTQFFTSNGRIVWNGGGANPKVGGDEFIGLRLNGGNQSGAPGSFTFVVQADRDLTLDNGARVAFQVINGGTTTTTLLISGAPGNGLVVTSNGHNQFTITAPVNQHGVFGNVLFQDEGRTTGVPFSDTVQVGKVNGKAYLPDTSNTRVRDCTGT